MKKLLLILAFSTLLSCEKLNPNEPATVRQWVNPSSLSDSFSLSNSNAFQPRVIMNPNGDSIIVWLQSIGAVNHLFFSEFRNGKWIDHNNPTDYIDKGSTSITQYDVAMSNDGTVVIAWFQDSAIFKSVYSKGVWKHPADVSDYFAQVSSSDEIKVAVDDRYSILIWSDTNVLYQTMRVGVTGAWLPKEAVNGPLNNPGANDIGVVITPDESYVYWRLGTKLQFATYTGNKWAYPTAGTAGFGLATGTPLSTKVIAAPDGRIWATFRQQEAPSLIRLYRASIKDNLLYLPAANEYISGSTTAGESTMNTGSRGDVIIAWTQSDLTNERVYISRLLGGKIWSAVTDLTLDAISPPGSNAIAPSASIDEKGNFILLWRQRVGLVDQLFIASYREGVFLAPATTSDFSSFPGLNVSDHSSASGYAQRLVYIWAQSDGAFTRLYRSEYR